MNLVYLGQFAVCYRPECFNLQGCRPRDCPVLCEFCLQVWKLISYRCNILNYVMFISINVLLLCCDHSSERQEVGLSAVRVALCSKWFVLPI